MQTLWGIDLGGTKIEGVVLGAEAPWPVLARERIPTEAAGGYSHILGRLELLVETLREAAGEGPRYIGIGTPGIADPDTGLMKNANTTALNGAGLRGDLERRLGIPVRLANDANCFAVAEARMGAVTGLPQAARVVFGVIMGTGVGGGLVIDGRVHAGRHGIGGEWGHNFLDESGGACYCGRSGCVETLISGPAVERFYHRRSGRRLAMADIAVLSREGDELAGESMARLLHFFGKALAPVINILDPDAIIIGGGLSKLPEIFTEGRKEVEKHIFNTGLHTPILPPKLGDSAGVFGAAFL